MAVGPHFGRLPGEIDGFAVQLPADPAADALVLRLSASNQDYYLATVPRDLLRALALDLLQGEVDLETRAAARLSRPART